MLHTTMFSCVTLSVSKEIWSCSGAVLDIWFTIFVREHFSILSAYNGISQSKRFFTVSNPFFHTSTTICMPNSFYINKAACCVVDIERVCLITLFQIYSNREKERPFITKFLDFSTSDKINYN